MKRYAHVLGLVLILIIILVVIYFRRETFKNHGHSGFEQMQNRDKLVKILKAYPDDKYIKTIPIKGKRKYSSLNEVEKIYIGDKKTGDRKTDHKLVFNKRIKDMTPTEKELFVNTIIRNNFGHDTFQNLFGYISLENMYTKYKSLNSKQRDNNVIQKFIPTQNAA